MDRSHSVDCTITEEVEICCCDQNTYPLSPCSSSETLMTIASLQTPDTESIVNTATEAHSPAEPTLAVWLPNLVDKWDVKVADVENFVASVLNQNVDVTFLHLLIFLYFKLNERLECINQVKLLHAGKQYSVLRKSDLSRRMPLLREAAQRYSTFQLFVSNELRCAPFNLLDDELIQQAALYSSHLYDNASVTYAEAIIKLIKRLTASMRTNNHKRTGSVSMADNDKFKSTLKRVFKIKPTRLTA